MRFLRRMHTFDSLELPGFRLLLLGNASMAMGIGMDAVSRSWLIYQMTGSPLDLGLVNAARGLPFLFVGLIAGVSADRYGRKSLIVLAQAVCASAHLLVGFLVLTNQIQVWHLYVSAIVTGATHSLQQPASHALMADLVGDKYLLNAVSLKSAGSNVSKGAGPAVAGLLIQALGTGFGFLVQGGMYALAAATMLRVRVPTPIPAGPKMSGASRDDNGIRSIVTGLRDGLVFVRSQRLILTLLVLGLVPAFLASPFVSLMPVFATEVFQGDARTQGLLLSALGVGSLIGALWSASSTKQRSGRFMLICAGGLALSLLFFAYSPLLAMATIFILLHGIFDTSYNTQNMATLQLVTPRELRGRVLGIRLLDKGLQPLGSAMYGLFATWLGAAHAVGLMAALSLLLVVGVALASPELNRARIGSATEDLPAPGAH